MDFVSESLFNGRRFRALTIVDNYSRECLAFEIGQSIKGQDVVAVMDRLVQNRSNPDRIQCDNVLNLESSFFTEYTDAINNSLHFSN
jgi:putative transposase